MLKFVLNRYYCLFPKRQHKCHLYLLNVVFNTKTSSTPDQESDSEKKHSTLLLYMPLQQTYLILGDQKNQIDSNMEMLLKSWKEDAPALQFLNAKKVFSCLVPNG